MAASYYRQDPVAVIGFACRLPGGNTTPRKLQEFLERGGIASNKVPESRFNINAHYDGSHKPRTMRPLGGMFLEDIDPADFDASFFENSRSEAISMDPNQRQMLEVVYEALENAGVSMEILNGAPVACFVGSYASDYGDMQNRDPEDKPANITVGVGRAILANRLSHFFNLKGPSMTIDTACSGSLVGVDVACRYLQSGEITSAIIATSNLYLNPEHVMDIGAVGQAHSPTGLCHTFDVSADGYVKAEAVSAVMIKKLSDAIRDGDPIRAVIRGSATNSDGRTPGIASPSADAQAIAIRAAYANAGIADFNDTGYLECHGTGTAAGDPTEVGGAGSVFSKTRDANDPLIIGSIKSNVGHAEPAAGISGLMKAIMAVERGIIPGNPTFINPNPKIDFAGLKVKATRTAIPWPKCSIRRASVNSFGYGGSNLHVVLEEAKLSQSPNHVSSYVGDDDDFSEESDSDRPYTIIISANDETSLRANIKVLSAHLINPRVKVDLRDLAYTLSERRSQLYHRAYVVATNTELDENAFTVGKKSLEKPRIGFVFTGQGAQWPQMGKEMLEYFPGTRSVLKELDQVLQDLPDPPKWSLINELEEPRSAEHHRQPEFSQPLVTALQLCIISVLKEWGVEPQSVVGHSSGEIAAAYTAGLLSRADAIKAAFYRGRAAVNRRNDTNNNVGMLAVGLSADALSPYLERHSGNAWIACFNSPSSLTISGKRSVLEEMDTEIRADGQFARLLQVDLAYHSMLMAGISEEYQKLLDRDFQPLNGSERVSMFSSVTGAKMTGQTDASYWKSNMLSPVRFDDAIRGMLSENDGANFLIEIGPSAALAGPITQIKKELSGPSASAQYCASWSRGNDAGKALFNVAGRLFVSGSPVHMAKVNQYMLEPFDQVLARNEASKDWRFKKYVHHDLLGSKVLGSSWRAPSWRKLLNIADVPWLEDHKMGTDILMPGAGYITMALEAMYQKKQATDHDESVRGPNDLCYRFRNIRFDKALVLEEGKEAVIILTLSQHPGSKFWHEFRISSTTGDIFIEHCTGLVRLEDEPIDEKLSEVNAAPLKYPTSGKLWYKAQSEVGYGFGPAFQRVLQVESTSSQRRCRGLVSLKEPDSKWSPQSYYPIHPASLDGCFQTVTPSLWEGDRSAMNAVLVPSMIDELIINRVETGLEVGLSVATSEYSGRGRPEEAKSYFSNYSVWDPSSGSLLTQLSGLRFAKLDTGTKHDLHCFDRVSWKPDVSFLTQDSLAHLASHGSPLRTNQILDLVAHKKQALKVLEINLDPADLSCLWYETGESESRSAYLEFAFASSHAKNLISVQKKHESERNSSFELMNPAKEAFGLSDSAYDLVIVKVQSKLQSSMSAFIRNLRPLVANDGYVYFVEQESYSPATGLSGNEDASRPGRLDADSDREERSSASSFTEVSMPNDVPEKGMNDLAKANFQAAQLHHNGNLTFAAEPHTWDANKILQLLEIHNYEPALEITYNDEAPAFLSTLSDPAEGTTGLQDLCVVRLSKETPELTSALRSTLKGSGWNVSEQTYPFQNVSRTTTILILDELFSPILTQVNLEQWEALKVLVTSGSNLLWVTTGAQMDVTNPNTALVNGMFRVIRMEDANAKLTTLDVESSTSSNTGAAINAVLRSLRSTRPKRFIETEFAERNGVLYVHRVVPDMLVNKFKKEEREGATPVLKSLHDTETEVSLRAERVGTFQGLTWCESTTSQVPVSDNKVEIEVVAAGVNFKDVAVTMGIVPENEYALGYEAAGFVKRLGRGVINFKVGDRVCFLNSGSYANRIQVGTGRVHAIPDSMSFEDAATIPSVHLASMYSLFDMGNLQKGQSVLIHSASGGVGISCIQLAQYMEAEIYVTVGSDEKRQFLADNYGIPQERMFSSRNTKFAKEILRATNGRGVDVIINSLIGEMLDESWRICADGGTMVEIGKKDIVERNTLSMEPFDRNCSYRAMDFSYTKDIRDPLIARLLGQIFQLVNEGHLKPIHPITQFKFNDIPTALTYIRSGRHIGKVIISDTGSNEDVKVLIRPAIRKAVLRPSASYLIVGGLKGLCGSLAIHMAQLGAKHIITCSRSGIDDEASQKIVMNCLANGCKVTGANGDITDINFVRRVFTEYSPKIAGVIQGAMILRDKPYEMMTLDDYHTAIAGKIQGTWALHNVIQELEQTLDFFTMLSSVSGIVGNKAQANYSAANTFMDAFAHYRRSLGLCANSVDLGLIEDVGYVAEQGGMDSHFDKRQFLPINETMLRKILDYSILQQTATINPDSAAQLITGIGYPLPDDSDYAREARFGYLFAQSGAGGGAKDSSQGDEAIRAFHMMHKSGAGRPLLVQAGVELLAAQFTKILRLETEMEPGKSLMAYGLDSLAGVEARNWIRMELGAELTTLDIVNASFLMALGEKLISKLPESETASTAA